MLRSGEGSGEVEAGRGGGVGEGLRAGPGGLLLLAGLRGSQRKVLSQFAWEELCLRKGILAALCEMVRSWAKGKVELGRPARR